VSPPAPAGRPEARFDLLVLGDCNPDLILTAPDLAPQFGQVETLVDSAELTIGGSGAIMACGAARLGCRTAIIGVVGDDVFGRFMADALRERGVETGELVVSETAATGVTVVLAREGDRGMVTFPGAIAALTVEAIDPGLVREARHVHVSSYFLQTQLVSGLPGLVAEARRAGATVSVDPNWDPSGGWDSGLLDLLGMVDILLPNAVEAMRLARRDSAVDAARRLSASGATVVVKLGAEGALAQRPGDEEPLRVPALDGVTPVDATGAGDSFDAGLIAGLLAGEPLEAALRLACACGALSTRAVGGTAAQPTLEEARAAAR
jgi:sugar/nucleoside kinase (ribokinase family)